MEQLGCRRLEEVRCNMPQYMMWMWDAGGRMRGMRVGCRRWDVGDGTQSVRIQNMGCVA